ncbi:hypothetical protein [Streptomyces sp. Isolate_45]|nr:hypothetical protein [Streptomyces sp. Isolate_45]MDA5285762.1 hypothetical protein [Streptomyces sp. Isolate_45]
MTTTTHTDTRTGKQWLRRGAAAVVLAAVLGGLAAPAALARSEERRVG